MPSIYRSNTSWKSKDQHDWAKEYTKDEKGGLSGYIQRHFDRIRTRKKK